jgi:protocatechuate 3,4-dioxygenase beta subunit
MKRKDFLKGVGLLGVGSLLPTGKAQNTTSLQSENACTLIPSETAGPFPLDLTANTTFFRQDIRETQTGVRLNLKLKIIGTDNCLPMQNVRVNVWQCSKDGLYSGYSQSNNAGQAGLTYLRGYQLTNANGEVEFITIFPGWYTGRICHIHFQVYVSSSYSAVSQLTFDVTTKNALYAANPTLYTKGADPLSIAQDNIFSDGVAYQLATLTPNATTGGYDSYLEVTVRGTGTTGLGHLEKENAKQFTLGQNFPNPYQDWTRIPLKLQYNSAVLLELWDVSGRKVTTVVNDELPAGDHQIEVNTRFLNIPTGNYVYQLQVKNSNGVYNDHKMMTAF